MKQALITASVILNIVLLAMFGFNLRKDGMLGATVASNITLAQGTLMIGNSLGYAEEGGNSGVITAEYNAITPTTVVTATTTLTTANAGETIFLGASTNASTITLPAATDGLYLRFVVTGALTGGNVVISSAEGSNIDGILMVNDADVVCADEDVLTIVTDGEVVGDRVELISDGTDWFILDSDVDAASKMTCTT